MKAVTMLAAGAVLLTGCFYRTTFGEKPPPVGAPVRVTLTPEASRHLAYRIGDQVQTLDGQVVSSGPDSLTIAVSRVEKVDHLRVVWNGEAVALSRWDAAQVDRRHFSAPMTALIAGGVVAAAMVVANGVAKCHECNKP